MKAQVRQEMSLSWVRLDVNVWTHPKLLTLKRERKWRAVAVFLSSIAYTGGHETDGFVTVSGLELLGGNATTATELVKAGLWEVHLDGWRLHNFGQYQPSKWTAAQRSEHGKRAAQARWDRE